MSDGAGTALGAGGGPGFDSPSPAGGGGGGAAPAALNPSTYIFDAKTYGDPVNIQWMDTGASVVPGMTDPTFSSWLNDRGIWIRRPDGIPLDSVMLQYTVNVPHSGWYSFIFGAYGWGTVYINGRDFYRVYNGEAWIRDAYLQYGPNTIYLQAGNQGYVSAQTPWTGGAVACQIGYQAGEDGGRGGNGYVSIQWD
jgi:hypothetical protein